MFANRPQGSRKLHKSGRANNNVGAQLVKIELTDLPKPRWTIAHPAHPSPTPLDHATRVTRFSADCRIIFATHSISNPIIVSSK